MVLGVCHEIDRGADHKVSSYELTTDKGLEAVLTRLGMFGVHTLVDARPVSQFGGGEPGTVGIARFVPGMGMSQMRINEPARRDRLLLISAFAMALLTMLGAAGESLGMDRQLKSNTSKTRTHSLFRQGCMLYELIPNMPEHRLVPLMQRFANMLASSGLFRGLVAVTE